MKNPFRIRSSEEPRPEPSPASDDPLRIVRAYHRASSHDFHRYASGPGGLDWENQPDPFRRYEGAPLVALEHVPLEEGPRYAQVFGAEEVEPARVEKRSISRLFEDSLALSAWKQYGESTWALRVNPSSGNLHPTEGYLLCGPIEGLSTVPMLAHYAPREHALEVRAQVADEAFAALARGLPEGTFFVALSSIHWREAWKYGERAYRYCQHDAGHALAGLAFAARGLGWDVELCDDLSREDLDALLGTGDPRGAEREEPEILIAVWPSRSPRGAELPLRSSSEKEGPELTRVSSPERSALELTRVSSPARPALALPRVLPAEWRALELAGRPNHLSPDHVEWGAIDAVREAARKPRTERVYAGERAPAAVDDERVLPRGDLALRPILRQRRSAVAFDGKTRIARDDFYRVLATTTRALVGVVPWTPRVHLALFVHRVDGLEPGLYVLVRDPAQKPLLQAAMQKPFAWTRPEGCPDGLDLWSLAMADARATARAVSCHQEIASDGAFSLGMIAEFDPALERFGAWFYPRLFWECGAVGQVLYLEAEAIGVRATGIGCFFDEPVHAVFGITTARWRSLYHFTVGGPVEDTRLQSWPAYPPR